MAEEERAERKLEFEIPLIMPDGRRAPTVLNERELIELLRLENNKNPISTLKYYRREGLLKPTQIGKENRYTSWSVIDFLIRQTK